MNSQRGITLVELLVVVAMGSLILGITAAYTVPWFAKESMRSSTHEVETYMQLARIEAVSRNQPCRFLLDTANREIAVFDMMGTANPADDVELYRRDLPDTVSFANPQGGAAVTLFSLGSDKYHTVFDGDGTVLAGSGVVCLFGGERYQRVSVFDAGGLAVTRWNGNQWQMGS